MTPNPFKRADGFPKTAIITGGASGIGAQTVRTFYEKGCNVAIADLSSTWSAAEELILSLPDPHRAKYFPTNITSWDDMKDLFQRAERVFGQVDIVIANAGMMESKGFFEFEEEDGGDLKEPVDAYRVIDVNLKGTMNTLRLAMYHMFSNPLDSDGSRGSIILIASTSGYFGGTGVVSYISSKHGVVGLCRASQRVANEHHVRVNVVAPFVTPTYITAGYSTEWAKRGLPANTVEDVAVAILDSAIDPARKGSSVIVAGKMVREIEARRSELVGEWLGSDIAELMVEGGKFFDELGGYPLPKLRDQSC
ncbi:NAD(P)-binding protein [Amniculicola lignicola CBS 123094]|uniref:NAD(P)-binding protein n=1 Tax=Amniculicola lignicola CBS 123094 TaxID=1392246 RepID=A0A6A5VV28_9PLEO|nr:NAD(P)-binding protein [Amniculicola lignicola CBS 123094]